MENLSAQILNPVEMINYQPGSVVSRQIIKTSAGNVTLFAFDQGEGLTEHTSPFDALVCLLDGKAEITISGQPFHLKAGEMILMPAKKPHALKATEAFKMMLVMIK
jgi:quercetin dioxygenase-like cupin family protein